MLKVFRKILNAFESNFDTLPLQVFRIFKYVMQTTTNHSIACSPPIHSTPRHPPVVKAFSMKAFSMKVFSMKAFSTQQPIHRNVSFCLTKHKNKHMDLTYIKKIFIDNNVRGYKEALRTFNHATDPYFRIHVLGQDHRTLTTRRQTKSHQQKSSTRTIHH